MAPPAAVAGCLLAQADREGGFNAGAEIHGGLCGGGVVVSGAGTAVVNGCYQPSGKPGDLQLYQQNG